MRREYEYLCLRERSSPVYEGGWTRILEGGFACLSGVIGLFIDSSPRCEDIQDLGVV
jgi:hypothetical protein